MNNQPYGYVYKITNLLNHKTYIGQRKLSKDKKWRQYMGSGSLVKAAIQKYGIENFSKSFITYAYSKEELDFLELEYILKEHNKGKSEYNLFLGIGAGGDTFSISTEEAKIRAIKNRSEGLKKKFSNGYTTWNTGKTKFTDLRLKEKSERAIQKGTYKGKGHAQSNETKEKMSNRMLNNKNSQIMSTDEKRRALLYKNSKMICPLSNETVKERHDRLCLIDLNELRGSYPKEEILMKLKISNGAYQKFLRSHGYTKTKTKCFFCEK